jgi:protein-S-isoprenylcysteine O-methyltransferase
VCGWVGLDGWGRRRDTQGYFGWFCWSISTQILLCNPLATVAFAYVSWRFFHSRIPYEEFHLARFFPEYEAYRRRVPTRIPFIP